MRHSVFFSICACQRDETRRSDRKKKKDRSPCRLALRPPTSYSVRAKKKNGFAASRILWPGRALDSVLPPGFRLLPSFHLRHACLDSHAKHFLDGCFLDTRGTPPTVSWKRFESGFCSRSRVFGFSFGFSQIPFLFVVYFLSSSSFRVLWSLNEFW